MFVGIGKSERNVQDEVMEGGFLGSQVQGAESTIKSWRCLYSLAESTKGHKGWGTDLFSDASERSSPPLSSVQ